MASISSGNGFLQTLYSSAYALYDAFSKRLKITLAPNDPSIQYPYHSQDTIPVFYAVLLATLPACILVNDNQKRLFFSLGAIFLTVLINVMQTYFFRSLAPNFIDACGPDIWNDLDSGPYEYKKDFTCTYPDRAEEASRSFPCLYSALAAYGSAYMVMMVSDLWEKTLNRNITLLLFIGIPLIISRARHNDYKAHFDDIVFGVLMGILFAYFTVSVERLRGKIGRTPHCDPRDPPKGKPAAWHLSRRFIFVFIAINFTCIPLICLFYTWHSEYVKEWTLFGAVLMIASGCVAFLTLVNICQRPVEACAGQSVDKKKMSLIIATITVAVSASYFAAISKSERSFTTYSLNAAMVLILIYLLYQTVTTYQRPGAGQPVDKKTRHFWSKVSLIIATIIIAACISHYEEISSSEHRFDIFMVIATVAVLLINSLYLTSLIRFDEVTSASIFFGMHACSPYESQPVTVQIIIICCSAVIVQFYLDLICIPVHVQPPGPDPGPDPVPDPVPHDPRKVHIGVCSSAIRDNTKGFVTELRRRFVQQTQIAANVTYITLPYSKLDNFNLESEINNSGIDVLILCHSIDNRRLSLTDVTDALYEKFIPRASKKVGKAAFIVIAHDFKWQTEDDNARSAQLETLQIKQHTTFEYAGTVLLAGKLKQAGNVAVCDRDWKKLKEVFENCASKKGKETKWKLF